MSVILNGIQVGVKSHPIQYGKLHGLHRMTFLCEVSRDWGLILWFGQPVHFSYIASDEIGQ